jgi:hypothetical protein
VLRGVVLSQQCGTACVIVHMEQMLPTWRPCCVLLPADILPGQGLYQLNETWKAFNCNSNNYGVANVTFGLAARPCRCVLAYTQAAAAAHWWAVASKLCNSCCLHAVVAGQQALPHCIAQHIIQI